MRKQLITAAILAAFAGASQFAFAADDAKKNMTGTEMKAATVSATLDLDTKQIGLELDLCVTAAEIKFKI